MRYVPRLRGGSVRDFWNLDEQRQWSCTWPVGGRARCPYLPRHGRRRDTNVRTRAHDAGAWAGCGGKVVGERVVGTPEDGHKGSWEEGKHKDADKEEGAQRRHGRVVLRHENGRHRIRKSCA